MLSRSAAYFSLVGNMTYVPSSILLLAADVRSCDRHFGRARRLAWQRQCCASCSLPVACSRPLRFENHFVHQGSTGGMKPLDSLLLLSSRTSCSEGTYSRPMWLEFILGGAIGPQLASCF
jgi:hypothetical protein